MFLRRLFTSWVRLFIFTLADMAVLLIMMNWQEQGLEKNLKSTVLSGAVLTSRTSRGIQPERWREGQSTVNRR